MPDTTDDRLLVTAALAAALVAGSAGATEPEAMPHRATGLWEVTSDQTVYDMQFAWSICVDQARDHLVADDIWEGFDRECELRSESFVDGEYRFEALCQGRFAVTSVMSGNFDRRYLSDTVVSFTDDAGEVLSQSTRLGAQRVGPCPDDIPPGAKLMMNGQKLPSLYGNR